ncbi:MAG: transcription-repair coupling factor, partial [Paracoccus sp. (in: a-proteobacteria)]
TDKLMRVELAPMSEIILDEPSITRFRQNYRMEYGGGTSDPLYESVSAGRKTAGAEHWLPWFHDRMESLFDYLPGASVVLDDHIGQVTDARRKMIDEQFDARRAAMAAKGRADTVYKPVPPDAMFPTDAEWQGWLAQHRVLRLSVLHQPPGPGVLDTGGRVGRNFAPERQSEQINLFGALTDHVRALARDHRVVIASFSDGARERLAGLLTDEGLAGATLIDDLRGLPVQPGSIGLTVWPLDEGFVADGTALGKLAVISEQDVLGDR